MKEYMITTDDNPYDPFDEFEAWYGFDISKGYNTTNRLASIAHTSDTFSAYENNEIVSKAIDELISTGTITKEGKIMPYRKVSREV